ncbi:ATP dependent DNA ligase [Pseudohyphozyma bogoriensis]|nr:ATP dependent DNA ligase [Pseudohyphozyma bogoriensis]
MVPTTHAPSVLARNPIEYSSFCSLLSAIRAIPPRRVTSNNSSGPSKQQQLLESWIEHARTLWDPLPVGTVTLFCRLFLPEEGVRRRYNLREQALSVLLEKYFKVRPGRFDGWCQAEANQRSESCGCLGMEVERWLNEKRESVWPVKKGLKITLGERLEKAYRVMTDLDVVTALVDREDWFERKEWSPVVGIQVQVPKSQRPGTTLVTTKHLTGDVAVETKYDGERLQIHIDLIKPYEKQIQIFSKSGRDSTRDRILLHPIIRAALNLDSPSSDPSLSAHAPFPSSTPCTTFFPHLISTSSSRHNPSPTKLIIEGEMVSYDESKSQIAEFWTLAAVKHGPYRERRARLESLVRVIPGFSMLAESKVINFDDKEKALPELREHFAKIIVERGEGLMLKHVDSIYNGYGKNNRFARWIKLKKDFIPGAGDTMDFHVLGASCPAVGVHDRQSKPHYHILFAASYGPTRDELCNLCHRMREEKHYFFTTTPEKERQETKFEARAGASGSQFAVYGSPDTEFTFSLADRLKSRYEHPAWIFEKPRVFELTGAGFQRQPGSEYYELRWPRITKTSRESGAPLSLERLQLVAERAMAVTTDAERAEHEHEELWRRHGMGSGDVSGGVEERMGKERRMWVRKLERADRVQEVKDSQEEEEREQRRTCQASSSLVESRRGLGPPLQLKTNVPTPARHGKRQPSTPSTALVERPAARPPPQQPRHSRKRSIEVLVLEGSDEDAPPPKPPTSSKLTTSPIPARHVAKSMPIIASPPRPFLPPVGPSSDAVGDEMDMISGFKRRRSDPVSSTTHPHAHKKLKRRATIAVSGDYPSLPYDLSALGPRLSISSLPPARSTTYWSYYPMISPSPSSPSSLSTATPPPAPPPPPPPNPIKSLDPTSFLLNPFDVFWAAGYTFPGSPPLLRPPTNGVIFLSSPDAWLSLKRDLEGASKEEGERGGTVMVVNRDWEFEHKLFGRHTVDFL